MNFTGTHSVLQLCHKVNEKNCLSDKGLLVLKFLVAANSVSVNYRGNRGISSPPEKFVKTCPLKPNKWGSYKNISQSRVSKNATKISKLR